MAQNYRGATTYFLLDIFFLVIQSLFEFARGNKGSDPRCQLLNNHAWIFTLPKSGTTYTLLFLANYKAKIYDRGAPDVDFQSLNGMEVYHSLRTGKSLSDLQSKSTPNSIYHTHDYPACNFSRAVGLFRHPFDFLISSYYFHFANRKGKDRPIQSVFQNRMEYFAQHYLNQKRLVEKSSSSVLWIRYEMLIQFPLQTFGQVVTHFGLPWNIAVLVSSLRATTMDKVSNMTNPSGRPIVASNNFVGKSFIRSGKVFEYKDVLSKEDVLRLCGILKKQGLSQDDLLNFEIC